jgi:sec-independent protein translocase protein TatC
MNWRKTSSFFKEEPEDAPLGESIRRAVEHPESFFDHIRALRKHLLRSLGFLVLLSTIAFFFLPEIMDWLAAPIGGRNELQAVEVTEPIGVSMRVAFLTGFAGALPYLCTELFFFVGPALRRKPRLIGLIAIPLVVIFFFGGMAFAYYLILPAGLPVLINFMNLPVQIRPSSYYRFVTGIMFWMGVVFEFPLLAYLLTAMQVISAGVLLNNWRIAVVIMSVLAAVITPTIDPLNMMLVMIPLVGLYALSILMAYVAERTRRSTEA